MSPARAQPALLPSVQGLCKQLSSQQAIKLPSKAQGPCVLLNSISGALFRGQQRQSQGHACVPELPMLVHTNCTRGSLVHSHTDTHITSAPTSERPGNTS